MIRRKAIIPLLYIFITYGYFFVITYMLVRMRVDNFSPLIPGKLATDVIFLFIGIPILICIPILFISIITLVNFKVMKQFQKGYDFYYIEMGNRPFTSRNLIYRSLLPVLMALAISQLINSIPIFEGIFGIDNLASIVILSLLLAPITGFLLLPIWVFKDSGIIRLKKKHKKRFPPELTYFGRIQHQSYKGFTGIATPIMYFITIYVNFQKNLNWEALIILLYPLGSLDYTCL
ncbi:hypothetical protein ES705_40843 [subsurface metagenome]